LPAVPRLRLTALVIAALCALLIGACGGGDDNKSQEAAATPQSAQQEKDTTGCEAAQDPGPKDVGKIAKPKERLSASKTYVATVSTNCGDFEITLDSKRAPKTGGSFKYLADKGYFDSTTFHRVEGNFVIQGGDPKGDGSGGPGYTVVEKPPSDLAYTRGVVAMAKTQLDPQGASGSQFFVVTAEDAQLPPDYALLGTVTKGMDDTVQRIASVPVNGSAPVDPVVIKSIKVTEK
jgi:cyclophilin family peptidyl-prolyl cis-trans isomerase